jgi:hypothetical protein
MRKGTPGSKQNHASKKLLSRMTKREAVGSGAWANPQRGRGRHHLSFLSFLAALRNTYWHANLFQRRQAL